MAEPIDIFTRKIVSNDVGEPESDPFLIEMLEGMLEDAKAGLITSAVVIGCSDEGKVTSAWTNSIFDEPLIYIGALEVVKAQFLMLGQDYGDEE